MLGAISNVLGTVAQFKGKLKAFEKDYGTKMKKTKSDIRKKALRHVFGGLGFRDTDLDNITSLFD